MKTFKLIVVALFMLALPAVGKAQESAVEMADLMRSNGKIYVVVGVVMLIILGILGYLIKLDLQLKKIEKQQSNH
jgi:hypothetical protein